MAANYTAKTKVISLVAGPGCGKSTTAALLFAKLKMRGINCELVTEYAKDKVWEESFKTLDNQLYVLGKQYHRLHRLMGKVDYIVTDAPLIHSLFYGAHMPASFKQLVLDINKGIPALNIFLTRKKAFNPIGRMQTEEEARLIDGQLRSVLDDNNIGYATVDGDSDAADKIMEMLNVAN